MSIVVQIPSPGEEIQVHQDQRIGLALAVLLVGAAGAFFFRNDPKPSGSSSRLKTAREVDARIAEKSIAPYLQNSGDEDHEPQTSAGIRSLPGRSRPGVDVGDHRSLPQLNTPDFLGPDDRTANGMESVAGNDGVGELAPIPFPDPQDADSAANARTSTPATGTDRMHVVQKGETLSSIAAKELGSSSRFLEVYEANRDQLDDANDVRVGMSLHIPPRRVAQTESSNRRPKPRSGNPAPPLLPADSGRGGIGDLPPIGVDPDQQPPGRAAESPAAKKSFEPAKRPPLGAKGLGTGSSGAEPPSKPIRKLTQLPPDNAGGKVAR